MTTTAFCLSPRANQLQRWQQAFPRGRIDASLVRLEKYLHGNALVWVHADDLTPELLHDSVSRLSCHPKVHQVIVMSSLPSSKENLTVLTAGASGYCHALATPELFQRIALVVANGGFWVGSEFLHHLTGSISRNLPHQESAAQSPALDKLSKRERAVALQVQKGASNQEIAEALDITERTVKAHLSKVFSKLQIRDRLQLILLLTNTPPDSLVSNSH